MDAHAPSPESRVPNPEPRFPKPESRVPNPGSRIPNPDSLNPNPESRIPSPESRVPNPVSRKRRYHHGSIESAELAVLACSPHARGWAGEDHYAGVGASALGDGLPALGGPVLRGRSSHRRPHRRVGSSRRGRSCGGHRHRSAREDELASRAAVAGAGDGPALDAPRAGGRDVGAGHSARRRAHRVPGDLLEGRPRAAFRAGEEGAGCGLRQVRCLPACQVRPPGTGAPARRALPLARQASR